MCGDGLVFTLWWRDAFRFFNSPSCRISRRGIKALGMEILWKNLPLIFWLSLGHTALWVGVVNRVHGLNWPQKVLKHLRHAHDVAIVVFPVLLWGLMGTNRGPLAYAADWPRFYWPVLAYFSICNVLAGGVVVVGVWRWLQRSAPHELLVRSIDHDIAAELPARPLGKPRYRYLVPFPGNELLHLRISEKELVVPRLPVAWDRLRVLHLSDLHFIGCPDLPYYQRVIERARALQPEIIVFSGDLLDRDDLRDWLASTLGLLTAPLGCYFVLGNHDRDYTHPSTTRAVLSACGWQDVAGRETSVRYRGAELVIGGTEAPWMGMHPPWEQGTGESFRLLVSHTPDNISWARRRGVDLMLSGHTHGGQVRLPGFGPVFSPSLFGCKYASGTFWESPTLMHVSRGIGAKHPLRINCPPDVSLLLLRAPCLTAAIRSLGERPSASDSAA